MPVGSYPKDPVLNTSGMPSRSWDVWLTRLQNIIDFGNPASSDTDISAATGIQKTNDLMRVQSATSGNTTITANPQITPGSYDGEVLQIEGLDAVKTVTISNGTGLAIKSGATFVLGLNDFIEFSWNRAAELWIEIGNNN